MSMNRIYLWVATACLTGFWGTAQRHEIGFISGGVNYIGEIGSTQYIQPKHFDFGIIYKRNFNQRVGLRASINRGKLSGNDANATEIERFMRGLSFSNTYTALGLGIEVNYVDLPVGEFGFSWTPYLHAGIKRMIIEDIYYNSFEQMARANGKKLTLSVPFGVGVKFNFGQYWVVALEVQPQFTFSDNLDGSYPNLDKQPSAQQFSTSLSNDWLVFTGISITYGFGRLPCCRE